MELVERVVSVFIEKFKRDPAVFVSPGRINLIGEHTDYNEGFVMPAAIDKHLVFAMTPSEDERCHVHAIDLDDGAIFSIHDLKPGHMWVNYLMGVLDGFQKRGHAVKGIHCVFGGNIPTGAGLSSSAATCCGFGFGVNEIFGFGLPRLEIARIAQGSENNFVGVMCGIMDQYACLFSKANSALLLDCRNLTHRILPMNLIGYEILLIDSKVKHSLASSAYNDRRRACEEGAWVMGKTFLDVHSLRDVSRTMLFEFKDRLSKDVFEKCHFIVEEMERTQQAARLLMAGDIKNFGDLMYQTHWGLSKSYEVSCEESDLLVTLAEQHREYVPGARQMGGGFGGCTINIVRTDYKENFTREIQKKYFASFKKEPDFYSVNLSDGVHSVNAN
jgi:galactokinase